ncbi:hypothetical protein VFPFJ_07766 [Purpureocillium lilacinum]|uniref:Uncharacterized protein n=1 Tax=Purpureocillium lilacinum TaxID=33203 RepID=A0A179H5E1_PURLI|nr:hypothetical protein VFPFJ_07766 [Purpureocillium lilacinum]OAQ85377.1 hypothetical protein VFPFJ_07766 [Purpureocillium lilacinum]
MCFALRHKPCRSRVTDGPSQPRSARTARAPVSPRRLLVNAPLSPVQGGPPPSLSKAAVPMRLRQPTASPRGPDRTAPRVAGLPPAPNLVRSRKRVENNDATCVWRRRLPSTLTTKRPSVISHARAINNAAKEVLVTVVYSCFFLRRMHKRPFLAHPVPGPRLSPARTARARRYPVNAF